jgi:hypothetical protein
MKLSPVDREALERAIELTKAENRARAAQITNKLKTESWREVAEFAAYHCQHRALQVKPWELVPVSVDEDELTPIGDDVHRKPRHQVVAAAAQGRAQSL